MRLQHLNLIHSGVDVVGMVAEEEGTVVAVEGMEEIWEVLEAVIEDLEVDLEEVVVVVVEVKGLAVSQWIPTALEELRAL